ncbi:MAG: hypothetical protein HPZ91_13705 [Lentisphaeria bacterium]|nr:hypothetical protein [Lentisphaeria bacterium]
MSHTSFPLRHLPYLLLSALCCFPLAAEEQKTAGPSPVLLSFVPDDTTFFTPLELLPTDRIRELRKPFSGRDADTGALAVPSGTGYSRLHEPWKKEPGRLLLEYVADLRPASAASLTLRVTKNNGGGDGVGLSVYAERDGRLLYLGRCHVPPAAGAYECRLELAGIAGRRLPLFLAVDANRTTHSDSLSLESPELRGGNGEALPLLRKQSWLLPEQELADIELELRRPDPSQVMTPHFSGRVPGKNVYSARDARRPMIGAHVYFSPEARERLADLRDVFDYITHDGKRAGDRLCELAGIPWVSIHHNPIPVNAYDEKRLSGIRKNGQAIAGSAPRYAFRLGATTGSEPHFSPDFHYTGHKKEEVEALFTSPGGARQFGEWLGALYGDAAPGEDSNGDGITFEKDFGFSAGSWGELGAAVPKQSSDYRFLHTLFKEHVISGDIRAADRAYAESGAVISSRLLSPQYEAVFGQSLRQLRIPSLATGVTYYSTRSNALDPAATQMRFHPSRLFESEKRYVEAFELRPPFWQSTGSCYGIFGPFRGADKMTFGLKTKYAAEAGLLFTVSKLPEHGKPIPVFRQEMDGEFAREFEIKLNPAEKCRYEFSLRSLTPKQMNNRVKATLIAPAVHMGGKRVTLQQCYAESETGYILDSEPGRRVDIGKAVSRYSPDITELRGGYIYSQAKRNGLRPVYNEFMPGSQVTNTPQNVWRSIYHELQFQPAGIVWFCYGGGAAGSSFSWMDCHYLATELAVLRGQLELLNVYAGIRRSKRGAALFLPPAAPFPLAKMRDAEQLIGSQLTPLSPDIFLADQTDQCAGYDNLILLTGFLDGASDRFWNDFLAAVPSGKKVIVIMGRNSFTEPGRRKSRDFRRSLAETLPLFPVGAEPFPGEVSVGGVLLKGRWNPSRLLPGADRRSVREIGGSPVVFAGEKLLVLSGIPSSGLGELASKFFGVGIADTRDAGFLRLLNRDTAVDRPGIYCADETQKLYIPARTPAFDLVRRRPAAGTCEGENVILVPEPGRLQLIDCGTARPLVKRESPDSAEVELHLPKYPFEGEARPELLFYAPGNPEVSCGTETVRPEPLGGGFWRCPVDRDGTYRVVSR